MCKQPINERISLICKHADGAVVASGIEWHDSLSSTNNRAKALFSESDEVRVVIADAQTGGRGTRGRAFHSPEGGVYMSVLHRVTIPESRLYRITPLAAVAVHRALCDCGVQTEIKWVNDLYLNGKKLCGILTEPRFGGGVCVGAVIGIGINLAKTEFPAALAAIATAVGNECDVVPPREQVIGRVLFHLSVLLASDDDREAMVEYRAHSMLIGRDVTVQGADGSFRATVTDVDADGGLVVREAHGNERVLRAGVEAIPADPI